MREIKFRAWDEVNKLYYYNVQNTYDEKIGDNFQNVLDNENLMVEEYTGLKDENGVDVYENDIVKTSDGRITVVEYKHGSYDPVYWYSSDATEVIGNIHQDSDLLVDDIERMIPDDIGNDIHEFLHGGDK